MVLKGGFPDEMVHDLGRVVAGQVIHVGTDFNLLSRYRVLRQAFLQ